MNARLMRWAVPVAVGVAVGGGIGINALSANASPELPPRTAAQLLADVQNANVVGLSGTVVQHADLGLPDLPSAGGGRGSSELTSLVAGSHTLRLWYAGPEKVRLALLGTLGESDVIRYGRDLWVWSSRDNTATHTMLPAHADERRKPTAPPTTGTLTPQQAAEQALAAVTPTTKVSTESAVSVAGRAAYELVLAPRDTRSLVGQVRLAIDGSTHVPLRVRIYAAGAGKPAFEVGFTHVSFGTPGDKQFRFSPPPGAKVTEKKLDDPRPAAAPGMPGTPTPGTPAATKPYTVVGEGWTKVLVVRDVELPAGSTQGKPGGGDYLAELIKSLRRVSGSWGSGRLLTSSLFSALLTDDGRLIAGPVKPELLYPVAAKR